METPSDAPGKVVLEAILSGHGDCEFEPTAHFWEVNGVEYNVTFFGAGTAYGCQDQVSSFDTAELRPACGPFIRRGAGDQHERRLIRARNHPLALPATRYPHEIENFTTLPPHHPALPRPSRGQSRTSTARTIMAATDGATAPL